MRRLLIAAVLFAAPALGAEPVGVRLGTHEGFGRVVFAFPAPVVFRTQRSGDEVVLRFQAEGDVPSAPGTARNVRAVTGGASTATVRVAPGSRLRVARFGNRVVLDVLDPAPAAPPPAPPPARRPEPVRAAEPAPAAASPRPAELSPAAQPSPAAPLPGLAETPAAAVAQPAPPPVIAAAPPPAQTVAPVALAAAQAPGVPGGMLLPFAAATGAAAFRHGAEAWVVFDERRPLDLAAAREDPALAGAAVQLLEQATLVRIAAPAGRSVRLVPQEGGWLLAMTDGTVPAAPLVPQPRPQRLLLPVAAPGQVVAVPDPETGQNLLVGTLRGGSPARGVPTAYRVPEFAIRPSWQGVVVQPLSDRTQLRAVPDGFAVETGDALAPAPDAAHALADASVLTRRFDVPARAPASLLRQLQVQVADTGRAPPQARLAPRLAAAQTMIALGLGAEAQSLLRLAVAEDPRAADDPDLAGLTAIAALLSGRPEEADGLLAPALSGTDEVALWRAVRTASLQPGSPDAAAVFAATTGLVLSYPAALRDRLLPLVAETMADGGAADAADALLAKLPDEPRLALARAVRLAAKGDVPAALALYDAMAAGHDRRLRARAAGAGAQLRLDTGALGPADAAAALERAFLSWRGDDQERDLRLRVAGLRAQAGQWRAAFEMLRETAPLYPDAAPLIQAHTASLLRGLLDSPAAASVPPLDWVALADENAEAVAQADAGGLLADRLVALDLPRRALPIVARMVAAAPPGVERARLGGRLAGLHLREGDAAAAAAALSATAPSAAPPLPAELAESRGLLDAEIRVAMHDVGGAAAHPGGPRHAGRGRVAGVDPGGGRRLARRRVRAAVAVGPVPSGGRPAGPRRSRTW